MTNPLPPLDLLTEIHAMLTALTSRTALLETNLAILNDKANGHLFPDVRFQAGRQLQTSAPKIASPNLLQQLQADQSVAGVPLDQPIKAPGGPARVFGCVYSPEKKPLGGVSVLIKNQKSELVSQLKTSISGDWETNLPIGKYAITYTKAGMSAMYKFLEVKVGMQEARIL